jgi:hypothetical protein
VSEIYKAKTQHRYLKDEQNEPYKNKVKVNKRIAGDRENTLIT